MVGSAADSCTTPYMRSTLGWLSLASRSASRQNAPRCCSTLPGCSSTQCVRRKTRIKMCGADASCVDVETDDLWLDKNRRLNFAKDIVIGGRDCTAQTRSHKQTLNGHCHLLDLQQAVLRPTGEFFPVFCSMGAHMHTGLPESHLNPLDSHLAELLRLCDGHLPKRALCNGTNDPDLILQAESHCLPFSAILSQERRPEKVCLQMHWPCDGQFCLS